MNVNVPMLKSAIVKKNTTLEAVAHDLGIDRTTLYRRLRRGDSGISLNDAKRISRYLRLAPDEALSIFWGGGGTNALH